MEGNAKGVNVKIGITNNPALSEMLFTFHGTVVKGNVIQVGISTIKD